MYRDIEITFEIRDRTDIEIENSVKCKNGRCDASNGFLSNNYIKAFSVANNTLKKIK